MPRFPLSHQERQRRSTSAAPPNSQPGRHWRFTYPTTCSMKQGGGSRHCQRQRADAWTRTRDPSITSEVTRLGATWREVAGGGFTSGVATVPDRGPSWLREAVPRRLGTEWALEAHRAEKSSAFVPIVPAHPVTSGRRGSPPRHRGGARARKSLGGRCVPTVAIGATRGLLPNGRLDAPCPPGSLLTKVRGRRLPAPHLNRLGP